MEKLLNIRPLFYIAVLLLLVIIVLAVLLFTNTAPPSEDAPANVSPTPVLIPQSNDPIANPPVIGELPRQNETINTTDPTVQNSEEALEIVRARLPYLKDFTSSTGREISIVIPDTQYQSYPWVLTVNIFGPDYQIPETSPQYEVEKAMFTEGANDVFTWIRSTGADPNNVLIMWSEKASVQERAEEWLE